jgi:hypothetical protein
MTRQQETPRKSRRVGSGWNTYQLLVFAEDVTFLGRQHKYHKMEHKTDISKAVGIETNVEKTK